MTWARFEQADINDPSLYPDLGQFEGGECGLPLVLVLGYTAGVQVSNRTGIHATILGWCDRCG